MLPDVLCIYINHTLYKIDKYSWSSVLNSSSILVDMYYLYYRVYKGQYILKLVFPMAIDVFLIQIIQNNELIS